MFAAFDLKSKWPIRWRDIVWNVNTKCARVLKLMQWQTRNTCRHIRRQQGNDLVSLFCFGTQKGHTKSNRRLFVSVVFYLPVFSRITHAHKVEKRNCIVFFDGFFRAELTWDVIITRSKDQQSFWRSCERIVIRFLLFICRLPKKKPWRM